MNTVFREYNIQINKVRSFKYRPCFCYLTTNNRKMQLIHDDSFVRPSNLFYSVDTLTHRDTCPTIKSHDRHSVVFFEHNIVRTCTLRAKYYHNWNAVPWRTWRIRVKKSLLTTSNIREQLDYFDSIISTATDLDDY